MKERGGLGEGEDVDMKREHRPSWRQAEEVTHWIRMSMLTPSEYTLSSTVECICNPSDPVARWQVETEDSGKLGSAESVPHSPEQQETLKT